MIRGFPNGETQLDSIQLFPDEYIVRIKGTWGSETSQYPQEEKTKVIPLVVASERGGWLNRVHVIPGGGCVCGVVGRFFSGPPARAEVINHGVR